MASKRQSEAGDVSLGGMFRSFGGFLDFLSNLAEEAEEQGGVVTRTGEVDAKKGVKAVYGFSVRVGDGGRTTVEPFGNLKVKEGRGPVVEETREPMVDVFDEGDYLQVIAELPGVEAKDIQFEVEGDLLNLSATAGERKYHKEVLLPAPIAAAGVSSSYRNGVLELKLQKAT
jgi:HSP20 family protein